MHFPEHSFLLLVAPPAWGKTKLFHHWVKDSQREFLFISPLRALANEVKKSLPHVWVALPEELLNLDWSALSVQKPGLIVVWDEVHLVHEWGESFRHSMLEAWYGFCLSGLTGVGFTATLTEKTQQFLRQTLCEAHTHLLTGDAGNFQFHHAPTRWVVGNQHQLLKRFEQVEQTGTLIFCRSKKQLNQLQQRWPQAWSCVGGETSAFQQRLESSTPAIIIATSCLSHGVNLPSLKRVILLDKSTPLWLAHQMRTRAGRKGEEFEVWCPWGLASCSIYERVVSLLKLIILTMIRESWTHFLEYWYGPRRRCRTNHSTKRT